MLSRFFPGLLWLEGYRRSTFRQDFFSGLTIAVMLIPQGMAYAMIAGLPPIYGLYASTIPLILYALLGTSRQLAVGPVAMMSLLTAAGVGALAEVGLPEHAIPFALVFFNIGVELGQLFFVGMVLISTWLIKPLNRIMESLSLIVAQFRSDICLIIKICLN